MTSGNMFARATVLLFIVFIIPALAEQSPNLPACSNPDSAVSKSLQTDTAKVIDSFESGGFDEAPKPSLLPANISMAERMFWGEHGLTRKIGLAGELTPESRKYELQVRRTMLSAHQISGFTTVALMLAACYYGQRTIDAGGDRNLGDIHSTLIGATITTYSLTAALSIFSPPPLVRRDESSTTTIHKALAWGHVIGMIATPILASRIQEHGPGHTRTFDAKNAHFHQAAGYLTTAVFTAAMLVVTF